MKVGDLVRMYEEYCSPKEAGWTGIIISYDFMNPVVFWNDEFPAEVEYADQLTVINEGR